jgi:hypothetical protein
VFVMGALIGLVTSVVTAFMEQSLAPGFSMFTLISGAIAFVFWTLMRRVIKHKKMLRNQFD